jgi:hypothetical protein
MSSVDKAIENGICHRWVCDHLVPVLDRQLAGDDGGVAIVPVIDNLQEIVALIESEGREAPIVEDQQIDAREGAQQTHMIDRATVSKWETWYYENVGTSAPVVTTHTFSLNMNQVVAGQTPIASVTPTSAQTGHTTVSTAMSAVQITAATQIGGLGRFKGWVQFAGNVTIAGSTISALRAEIDNLSPGDFLNLQAYEAALHEFAASLFGDCAAIRDAHFKDLIMWPGRPNTCIGVLLLFRVLQPEPGRTPPYFQPVSHLSEPTQTRRW